MGVIKARLIHINSTKHKKEGRSKLGKKGKRQCVCVCMCVSENDQVPFQEVSQ